MVEQMYGWRARIGIIPPAMTISDYDEIRKVTPTGVQYVYASMLIPGKFELANEDVTLAMLPAIDLAAKQVASAGVQIIMQGCGALAMFRGWGGDKEITDKIKAATGLPCFSHGDSEIEALKKMNIKKVAVFTPYEESVNDGVRNYLTEAGFEVVLLHRLGPAREMVEISPYGLYRPIKEAYLKAPANDGIFIMGGAMRTFQIIEPLEYDTGKPVVTAVQATVWKSLTAVNVREPINGYGKLLKSFSLNE
jgi:maleate isomerase